MNTLYDDNPPTRNSSNGDHLKTNSASSSVTTPLIQNSTDSPYQLRVHGIADQGAKSRVETQIRLELQLIDDQGNQPYHWSHIRLANALLTHKRRSATTSTLITMTTTTAPPLSRKKSALALDQSEQPLSVPEESMLYLDASVICDSDIHRKVKMCRRCVWREWKRADRKKTGRKLDNGQVYDEELMEKERHRILLFNSEPVLAFDQGECVLPTRITCYSRHHDERQGFRIKFTIHDYQGHLVAAGTSAPIMITDDHKNLSKLGDKRRRRKTTKKASKSVTPPPPPSCLPTPEEETSPTFDESSISLATRPIVAHDIPPTPRTVAIGLLNMDDYDDDIAATVDESKNGTPYLMDLNGYLFDSTLFTPTPPTLWSGTSSPTDTGSPVSSSPPSPALAMMYSQPVTIERMIPNQASIEGGTEITLLGSNFYEGMTWVFGDQPALITTYWSPTTLVCTVPPATCPGPVLVRCLDSNLWPTPPPLVFTYTQPSSSMTWQQLLQLNNDQGALGLSDL